MRILAVILACMTVSVLARPVRSASSYRHISYIAEKGEEPLPEGVVAVEWIGQSDSDQYIPTWIIPPPGSVLKCRFQFTDTRNSACCIGNIGTQRFGFGISSGRFQVCTRGWVIVSSVPDTEWHDWVIDEPNGKAYIDETSVNIYSHTEYTNYDYWFANGGFPIFRRQCDGWPDFITYRARISSLYIGTSSGALFDAVAVRVGDGEEAVGYLYDRVSGNMFGNAGTGKLEIGPDL